MGGNRRLQLSLNVLNLFNQKSIQGVFSTMLNGDGISFDEAAFYAGKVNVPAVVTQQVQQGLVTLDPRFLQPNSYQTPLQARFGVKILF